MIETVPALRDFIKVSSENERQIKEVEKVYPWRITEYYASLMDSEDDNCPVRMQCVPDIKEISDSTGEPDPLNEEVNSPVPGVIRVYPDRVAVIVTGRCPVYCRFCLRKRLDRSFDNDLKGEKLKTVIDYIKNDILVRDVLLTGGDPLMLEDSELDNIIGEIRTIKHVEIIRIGTRSTCTWPERITESLAKMLSSHHPLWLNTQFNHPKEITGVSEKAVDILLSRGIPVSNQSVLLKNINDSVDVMTELVKKLVKIRVRPYYLYQPQTLKGTSHFIVSIEKGIEIIKGLRGWTSGFAVPQYVLDTPYGKIPLNPDYMIGRKGDFFELMSYSGRLWKEFNPV